MKKLTCRSCGRMGCDCPQPTDRLPPPCPVCHRPRAACICRSHVEMRQANEAEEARETRSLVEARVQEAMQHYYNRDAAGLERFVRERMK